MNTIALCLFLQSDEPASNCLSAKQRFTSCGSSDAEEGNHLTL